ncbi:beta-ketoacyl synthase N-terminal-like domain-containing protein [Massilia pseudoviolaceinigra]|uniref:beta-ketoacyl synthase N-terminal-like domain-containing protein n=1 Tax=Massilia pseudoviolaceinigra TaxID=3057165 RepID=UPI002796B752|nr:beta-ketoacyl synthase N-terminal-like domain-containing protein [Massilia sp. CCM 9206]MDQ1919226.1 beta-ketoacyl synthase N-terminal-like domain-containing protein [Massilia sp. CCM 9206]
MKVIVTGMGFQGALAPDVAGFGAALRSGQGVFGWTRLARSGRSFPAALYQGGAAPLDERARQVLRGRPAALQASCAAALEALQSGRWTDPDCAIVVAGSNLHQAQFADAYERFMERPAYVNPRYAASFLDSTVVAAVSEIAGLGGIGFTTGAGMASGNAALFQGWTLIRSGAARACLVVGAMSDFSELEMLAFANLGALAAPPEDSDPARASIPFDSASLGFVYGQAAAAVLLESADSAGARGALPLARLAGASIVLDGNAGTEANADGEAAAMRAALAAAGLEGSRIDYINTHGTGTPSGDRAECAAISQSVGTGAVLNSTKAITGHTIGAAGVVELVATVIQMRERFVHPNPRLHEPIDPRLRFAGRESAPLTINAALSNGFSIGGFNTCVAVSRA